MAKTLLLISGRSEDQSFAAEVAMASRLSLQTVSDPRQGAVLIAQESSNVPVIFADVSSERQYQALQKALQDSVGLFSENLNVNAIHFITSEDLSKAQYLIQSPIFGNVIFRNYKDPKEAGTHYSNIVQASLAERAFGLSQFFQSKMKMQVVKLQHSSQKQNAVQAVKNYLLAAKFQPRMATVIANSVDELLMNAIFDAPVDELGRQAYGSTPRTTGVRLEDQSAVEMHLGFDGSYVVITAIDLYGSLDKLKLMTHISKIYTDEEYKVRTSVAGAGIGLSSVFRAGGSFFFVSEARVRTEVTVFFRRTDNFREFKNQFKFISTQFYF